MKRTRIHINQHNIKYNNKSTGNIKPVITAKDYTQNRKGNHVEILDDCLLYTSPSPRDRQKSRMPSSA